MNLDNAMGTQNVDETYYTYSSEYTTPNSHTHRKIKEMKSKLRAVWEHPAGPKTIHFWAPTFKWGLSLANISDFSKPPEDISYPQQSVIAVSGIIWSRYCFVITPWNWNLFGVNSAMSCTGFYQLSRKLRHDYTAAKPPPPPPAERD